MAADGSCAARPTESGELGRHSAGRLRGCTYARAPSGTLRAALPADGIVVGKRMRGVSRWGGECSSRQSKLDKNGGRTLRPRPRAVTSKGAVRLHFVAYVY